MFVKCDCIEGSIEVWFLNKKTNKTRFALLSCPRCDGGSNMGNGQKADEVKISEEEYNQLRKSLLQKVA